MGDVTTGVSGIKNFPPTPALAPVAPSNKKKGRYTRHKNSVLDIQRGSR